MPQATRHRLLLIAMLLVLAAPIPAHAGVGDIPVTGKATDRAGTPLTGVRISDGDKAVYTDSEGHFSIDEQLGNGFTLTATRAGLVTGTGGGTALPGTVVNFSLYYTLSVTLTPSALNPASASTIQITATSYSPTNSCVTWSDSSSGTIVTLDLTNPVPGGSSTWSGNFALPEGIVDRTYSSTSIVRDCSNLTALTKSSSRTYIVDSVAPEIDYDSLTPLHMGNTLYVSQPLMAGIIETGAGVDATTIDFEVDPAPGDPFSIQGTLSSSGWVKSPSLALVPGASYSVTLNVSDKVGNTSSRSWEFLALGAVDVGTAQANLSAIGINTGEAGVTLGTERWRYQPVIEVSDRLLGFPIGSKHPGWGTLATQIPLGTARTTIDLGSGMQDWIERPYLESESRNVLQQVAYTAPIGATRTVLVPSDGFFLPEIEMDLPIGTAASELVMDDLEVSATFANVCPDRSSGTSGCSPDPLRFYLPDVFAAKLENVQSQQGSGDRLCLPVQGCVGSIGVLKMLPALPDEADDPDNEGGIWELVSPLAGQACGPLSQDPYETVKYCNVHNVLYPSDSSVIPGDAYDQYCSTANYCAYETQGDYWDRKGRCISTQTGFDNFGGDAADCRQINIVGAWASTKKTRGLTNVPLGYRMHIFEAWWDSEWGENDGPYDELGIHWSTMDREEGWGVVPSADIPEYEGYNWRAFYGPADEADMYPQNGTGQPLQGVADEVYACFYDKGSNKIKASQRLDQDPYNSRTNTGGFAWGAATGTSGGAYRGWPQVKRLSCADGPSTYANFRSTSALLRAVSKQTRQTGDLDRTNGHLHATWGHKRPRMSSVLWDLLSAATSCTRPTPSCSVAAITWAKSNGDSANYETQKMSFERSNAFRYWFDV